MQRRWQWLCRVVSAALALGLLAPLPAARAAGAVSYKEVADGETPAYGVVRISGLTPYVFVPSGAGARPAGAYTNVSGMMERWGERLDIAVAVNAGIFYAIGPTRQHCFRLRQPDGVVIAGGVVLKSEESIDHSECDILVIDEDGAMGWAPYWADADALAAGMGMYFDAYGEPVSGKRVISAVTGFVPVVVGGASLYDPEEPRVSGWHNYVGHYELGAVRQVIGVRADGEYVVLTNKVPWTLEDAANAALAEGCIFAYNLDGGSSAETVIGRWADGAFAPRVMHAQPDPGIPLPTYIVFPRGGKAPVSATPVSLEAVLPRAFPAGVTLEQLAAAAVVTETLACADGEVSTRRVYSAQGRGDEPLRHVVIGGSRDISLCEVKSVGSSPAGTLYYVKSAEDTDQSLLYNRNTRLDGAYYDYSTGFTLSTGDDLSAPGVKTLLFSYVPGAGLPALTATVEIMLY